MIEQMIDTDTLELHLESEVKRYQQEYNLTNADMAWILLRIGTNYYFKDICSRGLNASEQAGNNGHT